MTQVLLSVGDASGERYAADFVRELRELRADTRFRGMGGAALERAGVELVVHQRELAVGGLLELIPHMGRIARVWHRMVAELEDSKPDLVVLVDSSGFNLPFARRAQRIGIPVFYYVAPQVWAWRRGRIHKLAKRVDRIAVIYPFDDLVDGLQMKPGAIAQLTKSIPDKTSELKFTMLARTSGESWPDFAVQTKERLGSDLRPLCVSAEPDVDAYRIFCERIASSSDDKPPNLGVIYLRDADELEKLTAQFDAEEQTRGAASTPVVVVCAKGKVDAEQPWLQSRRHAIVTAPVRIPNLVATMQQLLS